jgi:hypothetical protein
MRTLATKQPNHDFAKQKKNGDKGRSRHVSLLSTEMPLLQRQCACGGGCPRCQKQAFSMAQDLAYRNYPQISAIGAGAIQRQVELDNEPDGAQTESASTVEPDDAQTEPASTVEEYPQLSVLTDRVAHLAAMVRGVARDQTLPGRVIEAGATRCNPDTGQPEWSIDRTRVPRCMWPCAERHEQTHVEFMRMPCERVWLPLEHVRFWTNVARQYLQQGNEPEARRALREADAAANEAEREVRWYLMYMERTCRYDEATAYEAGIEVCNTAETRRRCTQTGELAEYNRQMDAWRRFMQNPPNCSAPQPQRRTH